MQTLKILHSFSFCLTFIFFVYLSTTSLFLQNEKQQEHTPVKADNNAIRMKNDLEVVFF